MCTQRHGDIFFSDVDAYTQALGIDIREMMFGLLGIFVRHVQTDMIDSMFFISLSMARATMSRGARLRRESYFCINSSPLGRRRIPP